MAPAWAGGACVQPPPREGGMREGPGGGTEEEGRKRRERVCTTHTAGPASGPRSDPGRNRLGRIRRYGASSRRPRRARPAE